MSRSRWAAVIGLLVVVVIVLATLVRARDDANATRPTGLPSLGVASASPPPDVPMPSPAPPSTPTPSDAPSIQPSTAPIQTPTPTKRPLASGDPRLLYTEFLLRVNDDRTTVSALNRTLGEAAQASDLPAVRRASIAILDFTDAEHDWLREHPPAACYADAHAAADAMLAAYAAAADAFIAWADAGSGLAGLAAFGAAVDAASAAGDALTAFGHELEATTCRI